MSLFRHIQFLKMQIVETKRLLDLVIDHPMMSFGYKEKLNQLNKELIELPQTDYEPKVQLMFSGNAVIGSQGIKSTFISKALSPFQEMVKTQVSLVRFGNVAKRGQAKHTTKTELYLTSLPVGSFGVELTQLENHNLFDSHDVSTAMKEVITLIADTAIDDVTFEKSIENVPKRNLNNLKKFLKEVTDENSILKMECNELGFEIGTEKVHEAYNRVSSTIDEENEIIIEGIFRGLLLDSGRFEFQNEVGKKLSGFISESLTEEDLINYDRQFLNLNCTIHLKIHKTKFKTGNEKTEYELLEIK